MTLAIKKPCLCKEKSIGHAGGGLPKKGIQLIRNKCSCNPAGPTTDSTGNILAECLEVFELVLLSFRYVGSQGVDSSHEVLMS